MTHGGCPGSPVEELVGWWGCSLGPVGPVTLDGTRGWGPGKRSAAAGPPPWVAAGWGRGLRLSQQPWDPGGLGQTEVRGGQGAAAQLGRRAPRRVGTGAGMKVCVGGSCLRDLPSGCSDEADK